MPDKLSQHVHLYSLANDSPTTFANSGKELLTDIQSSRFALSFEQATIELEKLSRMAIEPDGSFVWSGEELEYRWQIDGMLYDREGRMQRIELKGRAPRKVWAQLLAIFDWPLQPLLVHCQNQQQFLGSSEFLSRMSSEWRNNVR